MLSVIIPAFNEAKTLARVLDRILALPNQPQIIVVDDGSTDSTADIICQYQASHGIVGVICSANGGKGAAIQLGLQYASEPFTIIQDADLEYSPEEYETLLAPILKGQALVVYGSRIMAQRRPLRNDFGYLRFWLGGRLLTLITNMLFHTHLTDEATCYKLFPTSLLRKMNLHCRGFDFCPEVTAKTCRMGHRILEVPISYQPRDMSEGKKIRAWHGLQAIWVLLKYRLMPFSQLCPAALPIRVPRPHILLRNRSLKTKPADSESNTTRSPGNMEFRL